MQGWGRPGGTCAPTAASVDNRLDRRTGAPGARRSPARTAGSIAAFLVLTVVDAGLVVVTPLLVQRIVDDGDPQAGRPAWSIWLALAMAAVAVLDAACWPSRPATCPRGSARA